MLIKVEKTRQYICSVGLAIKNNGYAPDDSGAREIAHLIENLCKHVYISKAHRGCEN